MKRCLSPKTAVGLLVVAGTILLLAPDRAVVALPFVLLALCPLAMGAMMWMMMRGAHQGGRSGGGPVADGTAEEAGIPGEGLDALTARVERLRAEQEALLGEIARLEADEPPPHRPDVPGEPRPSRT